MALLSPALRWRALAQAVPWAAPAILLSAPLPGHSLATERWGLATFTPPPGWTREQVGEALGFTHIQGQRWGRIVVYGAVPTHGEKDLETDWNDIVVPIHHPTSFQRTGSTRGRGYSLAMGGGTFPFQGGDAIVMLFTFTLDSGHAQSVLYTGSGKEDLPELTRLLESMRFAGIAPAASGTTASRDAAPVAAAPVKGRYQYTSTRFDDGWVATATEEGVALTRGSTRAFLHLPLAWTDETRRWGDEQRMLHFWNRLLSPRWRVPRITVHPTPAGVGMISFGEGSGTDLQGQPAHVGLAYQSENGNAYLVEVATRDEASFRAAFPSPERVMALRGMNKFDLAPKDLEGTWSGGGSAFAEYVNAQTGLSAGWSGAGVSDTFTFSGDRFSHAWTGFSQQGSVARGSSGKRQGRVSVSPWTVTLSDDSGKQDVYHARFELVRGGRVLHLTHQVYPGLAYHLVRR